MDNNEIVQFALRWLAANFDAVEDFYAEDGEEVPFDRAAVEALIGEVK
jgi:hypothetical protein